MSEKKVLPVLTVVHFGNYREDMVVNDNCPACDWEPPLDQVSADASAEWHLGELWNPAAERGIGAYFQVLHCQRCGLVYATHLN